MAVNNALDEGRIFGKAAEAHKFEANDMCLQWAYRATTCMRDFCEAYGLKIIPSFGILQQGAPSAFILLRNLQSDPHSRNRATRTSTVLNIFESPLDNTTAAFEECFRCMLGAGLQTILPRGIARMVYRTATQMEVELPESVRQMIAMVAETSW